ncbi:hypothetical protein [Conchiformibius steedae]|uniref:hypothetical protein n=1 Tax=Conchiformibius steedae TaxID=153493 RepID=UPI0026EA09ED|nr:hypothetical protein [Conchiformibius steedae]
MQPDIRSKLIPNKGKRPNPNHARFGAGASVPPFHNPQHAHAAPPPPHYTQQQAQQQPAPYSAPYAPPPAAHYPAPLATHNAIAMPQDSMMAMAMVCQQAIQLQQDNQELSRENRRLEQDNIRLKRKAAYGNGVVITSHMAAGRYHDRRRYDDYDDGRAAGKSNNHLLIVLMMIWLGFALIVIVGLILR